MKMVMIALAVAAGLSGCGQYIEQDAQDPNYWLVGGHSSATKVALIFGYYDNYEACIEIVNAYVAAFPNLRSKYGCVIAENGEWYRQKSFP